MPDIVFPLSSTPGRRPIEGQGRLVNAMTEQLGPGGEATFARRPAPGLRLNMNGIVDEILIDDVQWAEGDQDAWVNAA